MLRGVEKLLVPRHHASDASEVQHVAVDLEDSRSRRAVAAVQLAEHELVAGREHGGGADPGGHDRGAVLNETRSREL